MLRAAILFFVMALIAAFLGFTGIAANAAWIGKIMVFVFIALAIASFIVGRRSPA
ncbi:MAG: DUF1328 domain-containing protein [Polyangiaceae bacterium]|jgi:uncharacterized membrane protein YtjA (UPF0391 family)|nr:DUF1328 domain-containing protein [Polyangiaceae bacterium]